MITKFWTSKLIDDSTIEKIIFEFRLLGMEELKEKFVNRVYVDHDKLILDLSQLGLEILPNQITLIDNIYELNVRNNKLKEINERFGELKSLRILDLSLNQISDLPNSFGKLTSLKKLYLEVNKFTKIPSSVFKMKNLEFLSMRRNKLDGLDDHIANLGHLSNLILSENNLKDLSSAILKLNLKKLNLSNNCLSELPEWFTKLDSLEELVISWNNFSHFPEVIFDMKKLKKLDISYNKIRSFPKYLYKKISHLENVKLEHNRQIDN